MKKFVKDWDLVFDEFITYGDMKAVLQIISVLNKLHYTFDLYTDRNVEFPEIHIGLKTNKYALNYVKKVCPTYKSWMESDGTVMLKFGNRLLYYRYNMYDYAFLIKLTKDDYYGRTIHLIFGGYDLGTYKAIEFLSSYSNQIYKRFKQGHYCIAVKVDFRSRAFDMVTGIIDLTDDFFNTSNNL
ncbi:hypothetical protein [Clostridium sp. chh4-2]|uniref:hypothetical protein n=1 Tax=Clostridium sp. chh4-2 TaxID=2067550 RepID=UPI0015E17C6C|nr:hypothetical protein [Clostridium sp. chh4-2]